MTVIEYIITGMTPNNGTYEWHLPISHSLDGDYYLVVWDYNNNSTRDSVIQEVYQITDTTSNIPGYPIILIGLMIGITTILLTIKSRKR